MCRSSYMYYMICMYVRVPHVRTYRPPHAGRGPKFHATRGPCSDINQRKSKEIKQEIKQITNLDKSMEIKVIFLKNFLWKTLGIPRGGPSWPWWQISPTARAGRYIYIWISHTVASKLNLIPKFTCRKIPIIWAKNPPQYFRSLTSIRCRNSCRNS